MSLPRILFAPCSKARTLKPMTECIMHSAKQIICCYWSINPHLVFPYQTSVLQHGVVIYCALSNPLCAVTIVCSVDSHPFICTKIAHGIKGIFIIRVSLRVKECELISIIYECIVL